MTAILLDTSTEVHGRQLNRAWLTTYTVSLPTQLEDRALMEMTLSIEGAARGSSIVHKGALLLFPQIPRIRSCGGLGGWA